MSAFVVGREHIRFLVSAARSPRIVQYAPFSYYWNGQRHQLPMNDREAAAKAGQLLWNENIRSVEGRYPDCVGKPENMPGPVDEVFIYAHSRDWTGNLEPVQVLKACNCYEYQSCEHEGWKTSEARAFIEALRSEAIRALPGYETAQWEVREAREEVR